MEENKTTVQSIDEYIRQFSPEIQEKLQTMRNVIKEAAPEAEETISYRMPAFAMRGILVYFAAFKNHIGFYPTASGISAFQDELSAYHSAKGSVQFPLKEPLPCDLISKIVTFRVAENLRKEKVKKKR